VPSLKTPSTLDLRAEPQVGSEVSASIHHGCAREVVLRALDELRPNPRNARRHHKRKIRDLANHIMKVGFIGAIIIDETGLILAGHARYLAAKLLGFPDRTDALRQRANRGAETSFPPR
jgi:ParB-like nuclease family protein